MRTRETPVDDHRLAVVSRIFPFPIKSVVIHDKGEDCVVLEANGEWMFRFLRDGPIPEDEAVKMIGVDLDRYFTRPQNALMSDLAQAVDAPVTAGELSAMRMEQSGWLGGSAAADIIWSVMEGSAP